LGGTAIGLGSAYGSIDNAYGIYVGKINGSVLQYGLYIDTLVGSSTSKYSIYTADTSAPCFFGGGLSNGTVFRASGGNEGGELRLEKAPNGTIAGTAIVVDAYIDTLRIFESGSPNRGVFLNFNNCGSQSELVHTGNAASLGIGSMTKSIQAVNFTANKSNHYFVNTNGGALTVTLPAAPAQFDTVKITDYHGSFTTNNLTIARNGSLIMELAENLIVSTNNVTIELVYLDATIGWKII
jgi:hypothetical protein